MSNLCWNSAIFNFFEKRYFSNFKKMEQTLSTFQPTSKVVRLLIQGLPERRIEIPLSAQEQRIFHLMLETVRVRNLKTTVRVAGGWVRDKLLGRANDDIDFAVDNMKGSEFAAHVVDFLNRECPSLKTSSIGVIQANPDQSKHLETATTRILDMWLDFANLRTDTYLPGSRIPVISIGTPQQDAERRDLTINAMFYNLSEETFEDFTGKGVSDLETGTIRTPLPPRETFLDDPLRVLRTVRFATRFGFKIDETVRKAIIGDKSISISSSSNESVLTALCTKVSRERVGIEVDAMLSGARPIASIRSLYSLGLLPLIGMAIYPLEELKKKTSTVAGDLPLTHVVASSAGTPTLRPDLKLAGRLTLPPLSPSYFTPSSLSSSSSSLLSSSSSTTTSLYEFTEEGSFNSLISSQLPDTWTDASMPIIESLDYLFNISPSFDTLCTISSAVDAKSPLHLPTCGSIGFCISRDPLSISAPEALVDHSTKSIFNSDEKKTLSLAALLYPLSNAFGLIGSSFRPEPLPNLVILHGLKLPGKVSNDVQAILLGAHQFASEADLIIKGGISDTTWLDMRLRIGQSLRREARDLWHLSLYLSIALHLTTILFGPVRSIPGVQKTISTSSVLCLGEDAERQVLHVINAHATLSKLIRLPESERGWALDGCWTWKALLDGEAIAKTTGAKGPEVGYINERQVEWRLLNPSGTEDQCKEYVLKHASEWISLAKTEHESTRAKAKAQACAKAAASKRKEKIV
jgi:tRNA nucleotidyltransferase/poly(A) polymerase